MSEDETEASFRRQQETRTKDERVDYFHNRILTRWEPFTDRELRDLYNCLADSPSGGSLRAHDMMAEIVVEANRRGPNSFIV